jgi:hypothetical protein
MAVWGSVMVFAGTGRLEIAGVAWGRRRRGGDTAPTLR